MWPASLGSHDLAGAELSHGSCLLGPNSPLTGALPVPAVACPRARDALGCDTRPGSRAGQYVAVVTDCFAL